MNSINSFLLALALYLDSIVWEMDSYIHAFKDSHNATEEHCSVYECQSLHFCVHCTVSQLLSVVINSE